MTLNYFAYGSNLHPVRFRERVASARPLGITELIGHSLRFHKRGQDGSGKCNAWPTRCETDRVIGVIYQMAATEKDLLDAVEGVGKGYELATRSFDLAGDEREAFFYQAHPNHIDDTLRPFTWYKALVVRGCQVHHFPRPYIRHIERVEALWDPDTARAADHSRILKAEASPSKLDACF